MTIKRVQYIEIPDSEWEAINADPMRSEESKLTEACWSVNAIIVDEEHFNMED